MRLPTVFFAEGGGGRPGDTDYPVVSALDVRAFALWARPLRAGAADRGRPRPLLRRQRGDRRLLGPDRRHRGRLDRHGRPGDDRRRRAGRRRPRRGRPDRRCRRRNGVVDVRRRRRGRGGRGHQDAARLLPGARPRPGAAPDQDAPARPACPSASGAPTRSRPIIETLADEGSVTFLRERFAPEMVTALARIEGRPVGVIANNTMHMAGAITSDARRQGRALPAAVRRVRAAGRLARRHPGHDGRPAGRGDRARAPRLAPARRRRRAARAARRGRSCAAATAWARRRWSAGSLHEPLLTVAWPSAHLGPMGLEGAVRLGAAQGARGDRGRRRARAARARGHRRRAGERQGAQRRASSSSSTT